MKTNPLFGYLTVLILGVFLLPVCLFILGVSWSYVAESWAIREVSPEPGGIPAVFLLKTLLLLLPLNLMRLGRHESSDSTSTISSRSLASPTAYLARQKPQTTDAPSSPSASITL